MRSRERNERNTGGAITGDGERGWGRKKKEIAVDPTRGSLQLFGRGCAYAYSHFWVGRPRRVQRHNWLKRILRMK